MISVLAFTLLLAQAPAGPAPTGALSRIEHVERWVDAVIRHRPGTVDAAAAEVGSWSNPELQALWVDVYAVAELLYHPRMVSFTLAGRNRRREAIRYSTDEFRRLKASVDHAREVLGPEGVLRRGALLHTDIAMNIAYVPERVGTSPSLAPERVTAQIGDGRTLEVGSTAIHWETARMLVDHGPRDTFARDWYRATAAWMQQTENDDIDHIDHAVELFPDDRSLLFLDGCMHEVLASPRIQSSVASMRLPPGFLMNVGSARAELKTAEHALRQSTARGGGGEPEWYLHYGRVLDLLGEHDAAIAELSHASGALDGDELEYIADLFLGAAHEGAGHWDAARAAYQAAAERAPSAQSPIVALMQLARRRGDRRGALTQLAALRDRDAFERDDPWWSYAVSQARNAGVLLEVLWHPFQSGAQR